MMPEKITREEFEAVGPRYGGRSPNPVNRAVAALEPGTGLKFGVDEHDHTRTVGNRGCKAQAGLTPQFKGQVSTRHDSDGNLYVFKKGEAS